MEAGGQSVGSARFASGSLAVVAHSIADIVAQHAEDAAALRNVRTGLVRAPHVKLLQLERNDERLAANLDGLLVAGEVGVALCNEQLATPSVGGLFVATVLGIEQADTITCEKLIALARIGLTSCENGLLSAFGWVSPSRLRGHTKYLLASPDPFYRGIGLVSCEMHGVAADAAVNSALQDPDPGLRARALRVAGRLGGTGLRAPCLDAISDGDDACRFEAACAALVLGDRGKSVNELKEQSLAGRPRRDAALIWLLQALEPRHARVVLKALSVEDADARLLIRSIGVSGDPHFVPWLLAQMEHPVRARIAGEAFSLITGLDLAYLDLDLRSPPDAGTGPSDDPNDDNVALDEDESLAWPDVDKLRTWWQSHQNKFVAGTRYFMGQPLSADHCTTVLKTGFQRQRILAARHLSLLRPGTRLFNCAAPAWRQQRVLAAMS